MSAVIVRFFGGPWDGVRKHVPGQGRDGDGYPPEITGEQFAGQRLEYACEWDETALVRIKGGTPDKTRALGFCRTCGTYTWGNATLGMDDPVQSSPVVYVRTHDYCDSGQVRIYRFQSNGKGGDET